MIERTEELGLAGVLPIMVGGERVELRTLNLNESEKWLARLDDVGSVKGNTIPVDVTLELVLAYDLDHVLGSPADAKQRFTKRELYDAANQMVSAEDPFLEDARSVVTASGLFRDLGPLMYQLMVRSRSASSTSGGSPNGGSTPRRSAKASLKSVS